MDLQRERPLTNTVVASRTRARRWFWLLVLASVGSMGALYRTAKADPSPGTAIAFFVVAAVVLAATLQAARIWLALDGPI